MRGLNCNCQMGRKNLNAAPSWWDNLTATVTSDIDNIWNDVAGVWNAPMDTSGGYPYTTTNDPNLVGQTGPNAGYGLTDLVNSLTENIVIHGLQDVQYADQFTTRLLMYAVLGAMAYVAITDGDRQHA